MFLSNLKSKLDGAILKFKGRTDFLEAVCAAAALVAAADGEIDDKEIAAALQAVKSNPKLAQAFKQSEIEKTMDAMLKRAQSGRVGRASLLKELTDVKKDADFSDTAYLTALDVADADGNISSQEKAVLANIAKTLNVSASVLNQV